MLLDLQETQQAFRPAWVTGGRHPTLIRRWSRGVKLRIAVAASALSGFVALSYELVWYRVLAVMMRGTSSAFGLLLGAYLAGIAIGARASAVLCRGPGGDEKQLRALAWFVALANGVAALVVPVFAWSAKVTDFRLGLAVVGVGAAFLGAVLPLVSHFGIEPDDRAGARLSYVYLGNIVGSSAGSLVTGFVLMDRFSIATLALLLAVLGFVLAAALLAASRSRSVAGYGALAACAVAAVHATPLLLDRVYERLVYKNEWDGTQRFAQIVENRHGVITVTADGSVYGGGGYDGVVNTSLQENEKNGVLRAYLVGALHESPKEVLMVGLASGSWAQVVANLPGIERMTIIEINPGYVDVVAHHADTRSVLQNPKVSLVIDDGRRWLQRNEDRRFDVVVMNTTMHWRAHATNILSLEFMEIVRRHLHPRGVFYFNTTDSLDAQGTAAHAFPHMWRITNFAAVSDSPFRFDRERWRSLLETMTLEGKPILDLDRAADRKIYDDLLGFNDIEPRDSILDRHRLAAASFITDDNMVVEWKEPLRYPELR